MPTIYQIIIIALAAAFLVLFATVSGARYEIRDWCDTKKLSIIAKMLDCDFCFSFWTNLIVALIISVIAQDTNYILVSIFSTPITRFLI